MPIKQHAKQISAVNNLIGRKNMLLFWVLAAIAKKFM